MTETRGAAMRQAMPSRLPPQLIIAWLPTRDVASALRVSKDWRGSPEPIFKAIAGRHGLRLVDASWRETVRQYRSSLGDFSFVLTGHPTPLRLHTAARRDDVPAIQRLISEGVNVNHATPAGLTALHYAALRGNLSALNALIAGGADLNAHNRILRTAAGGGTPLHVAANSTRARLSARYYCAARLIEAGANARLLNGDEQAPYQSQFPAHVPGPQEPSFFDFSDVGPHRFRKLLEDAFHAQR